MKVNEKHEIKNIKHIEDNIWRIIGEHESEIKRLREIVKSIAQYDLTHKEFNCLLGLSDENAICSKCEKALAKINDGWDNSKPRIPTRYITYPYGMSEDMRKKVHDNDSGCRAWQRKIEENACGCGGYVECECGYYESFCADTLKNICPFCGRTIKKTINKKEGIEP